jgi:hypothetical protein
VADFCSAPWPVFTPPLTGGAICKHLFEHPDEFGVKPTVENKHEQTPLVASECLSQRQHLIQGNFSLSTDKSFNHFCASKAKKESDFTHTIMAIFQVFLDELGNYRILFRIHLILANRYQLRIYIANYEWGCLYPSIYLCHFISNYLLNSQNTQNNFSKWSDSYTLTDEYSWRDLWALIEILKRRYA